MFSILFETCLSRFLFGVSIKFVSFADNVSSLCVFWEGGVLDGEELVEELFDERNEGDVEDSVFIVFEELVICEDCVAPSAIDDVLECDAVIVNDFSKFGKIWLEANDFLRWFNRSFKSFIELE